MSGSRTAIAFLAAGLLWGCAARSPAVSPPATGGQSMAVTADAATPEGRSAILDAVLQILAENFASGTGPGEDPELALEAAQPALVQATDAAAFYSALNETLSVSRSNHLYAFRPGRDLYDRDSRETKLVGATLRDVGGYLFVADVWEGGPAFLAGLRFGDELLPLNGEPAQLDPLPAGTDALRLWVRQTRESEPVYMDVTPVGGETLWYLTEASRASIRKLPAGNCRVGLLHLRTFADETLVNELTTGAEFNDAHGLILDLRGNAGGEVRLAGELMDLLTREPSVWITYRDHPYPFPATSWNLPLVVLVDENTRSAAEIFAAAVQSRGLGTVVGIPTPGQVQGSRLFPLPDGARLLVPVSDVILPDGDSLEGRGVIPDEIVDRPIMYAAGDDPQLNRAVELLQRQLACPEELPDETFPHENLPRDSGAAEAGSGGTPVQ